MTDNWWPTTPDMDLGLAYSIHFESSDVIESLEKMGPRMTLWKKNLFRDHSCFCLNYFCFFWGEPGLAKTGDLLSTSPFRLLFPLLPLVFSTAPESAKHTGWCVLNLNIYINLPTQLMKQNYPRLSKNLRLKWWVSSVSTAILYLCPQI